MEEDTYSVFIKILDFEALGGDLGAKGRHNCLDRVDENWLWKLNMLFMMN